jgi:L-threonylcarbamoyladenylate synthase
VTAGPVWYPERGGLELATTALRRGDVIGFPTDTVYGLAALASAPGSRAALSAIKGRSKTQPLIVMCSSIEEVRSFAELPPKAKELAQRFWPGPLTLILASLPGSHSLGGGATVGVRIPAHALALQLLAQSGPLATTSANRHGRAPVSGAVEALAELPGLAGALTDGEGHMRAAEASSILDLSQEVPVLVRAGRLGAVELGLAVSEASPEGRRD